MLDSTLEYAYICGRVDLTTLIFQIGVGSFYIKLDAISLELVYAFEIDDSSQASSIVITAGIGFICGVKSSFGYLYSFNLDTGDRLGIVNIERPAQAIVLNTATNSLGVLCQSDSPNVIVSSFVYASTSLANISETVINRTLYSTEISVVDAPLNTLFSVGVDSDALPYAVKLPKQPCNCNQNQDCLFFESGAPLGCTCKIGYSGPNCTVDVCRYVCQVIEEWGFIFHCS